MSVSIPNIIQVVGVVFIVGCFAFVFVQLYSCVRIACLLVYFFSLCFFWSYCVGLIIVFEIGNISQSMSWSSSYGSWIYNYLCNQCLSPLKL
jgi:hypothetical protein